MTKSDNPVLLLTNDERAALRKAKITVRDLGNYKPEDVVKATGGVITLERARKHCALSAHHDVDGIGMSLATDLWKAGFGHPRELVGLSVEALAGQIEAAWNRGATDDNYLRTLKAAVEGIASRYGTFPARIPRTPGPSAAAAPADAARPRPLTRHLTLEEGKPKRKPLPDGTKHAEILTRPYVATLDQVHITRQGDTAIIEYAEDGVWATHLAVGPKLAQMTDQQVLELFNSGIKATEEHRRVNELPAIEIPVGNSQLEWCKLTNQWLARGHVLRCIITSADGHDEDRGPRVVIDDKELSWQQFGRVIAPFAGWGARIVFVPDDELDEEPHIEVREPNEDGR